MKKLRVWLRVLTLVCYFLPFIFFHTTCVGASFRVAFNREEAAKNEAEAEKFKLSNDAVTSVDSTNEAAKQIDSSKTLNSKDTSKPSTSPPSNADTTSTIIKTAVDDLLSLLVTPTEDSLSAFGYFAYFEGGSFSLFIAASILFGLLALIFVKWLRKKKLSVVFSALQLLCMLIIVVNGLILDHDMLWGAWTLLFVLGAAVFDDVSTIRDSDFNHPSEPL